MYINRWYRMIDKRTKTMYWVNLLLVVLFGAALLYAESLLDHNTIHNKYFKDYKADYKDRKIKKAELIKTMNSSEYEIFVKQNRSSLVSSRHLKAFFSSESDLSESDLTRISYKLSSSGFKNKYEVKNIFDEDPTTAWVENSKDFGKGEWIRLDIENTYRGGKVSVNNASAYRKIIIFPGYGKSEELFYQNNRLKSALLFIAVDDSVFTFEEPLLNKVHGNPKKYVHCERFSFADEPKYHYFHLPYDPTFEGSKFIFMLFIEDVYKGSKYNDTCVSEIQLVW